MSRLTLNREQAARCVFGSALIIIAYRWLTHSLVHQWQQPTLFETDYDYTYWAYQCSRFAGFFVQNKAGAILFDLLLLVSTAWCCADKGRQRLPVLFCAIWWSLYGLGYNSYVCHHTDAIVGMMVLPYAFLARSEKGFRLSWDLFRYFCLYLYTDAFVYKAFVNGNLFWLPAGVELIKTNQSHYMLQNPGTAWSAIYRFFITHEGLSYGCFAAAVLGQGCMAVGFFTRRFDRWLFLIPILFHTVTFLFIDVNFYELLVLNFTLLPIRDRAALRDPVHLPVIPQ
ncbi:MAG: hypothetical protein Q8937_19475 [Bacteroidota bacterium]|nr:hypothetical protein [Bacteroidota bacterium]MDP4260417.1 hypothetical protein [Bacteroidota bacterium]